MKSLATDPMRIYSNIWQGCYIYMRFGEYTIAKCELQKAIDLNPNDWISYRHMGAVLLKSGDPDAALDWYKKVMEYDPYLNPGVHMNIGIAHYLKDDTVQAIDWLKEAAIKRPTILGCHILLASIYGNIGETVKASEEKEKILSLLPFFKLKFYGQAYQNPDHRNKIVSGLRKTGLTKLKGMKGEYLYNGTATTRNKTCR